MPANRIQQTTFLGGVLRSGAHAEYLLSDRSGDSRTCQLKSPTPTEIAVPASENNSSPGVLDPVMQGMPPAEKPKRGGYVATR